MKKIMTFIISLVIALSMSSCYAQYDYAIVDDDVYQEEYYDYEVRSNVDFNLVITYGVPYYYHGSLLYYIYEGLYYYPFYYHNYWYVRAYSRPYYYGYRPYFRPHHYDYRFRPGHHHGFEGRRPPMHPQGRGFNGQGQPHQHRGDHPEGHIGNPSNDHRPNIQNRPNIDNRRFDNNRSISRPQIQSRPSIPSRPSIQSRPSVGRSPMPSRSVSTPSRSIGRPSVGGRSSIRSGGRR